MENYNKGSGRLFFLGVGQKLIEYLKLMKHHARTKNKFFLQRLFPLPKRPSARPEGYRQKYQNCLLIYK